MSAWEGFPDPDDGTDGVRCECGRFVPCRHCPTPIDPDAEAVEALITASGAIDEKVGRDSAADDVNRAYAHLAALREQGWDVVRRAES